MKELADKITSEMTEFLTDVPQVLKGNKAAGARTRKNTINLQVLFKQWRKDSVAATKKQD